MSDDNSADMKISLQAALNSPLRTYNSHVKFPRIKIKEVVAGNGVYDRRSRTLAVSDFI